MDSYIIKDILKDKQHDINIPIPIKTNFITMCSVADTIRITEKYLVHGNYFEINHWTIGHYRFVNVPRKNISNSIPREIICDRIKIWTPTEVIEQMSIDFYNCTPGIILYIERFNFLPRLSDLDNNFEFIGFVE